MPASTPSRSAAHALEEPCDVRVKAVVKPALGRIKRAIDAWPRVARAPLARAVRSFSSSGSRPIETGDVPSVGADAGTGTSGALPVCIALPLFFLDILGPSWSFVYRMFLSSASRASMCTWYCSSLLGPCVPSYSKRGRRRVRDVPSFQQTRLDRPLGSCSRAIELGPVHSTRKAKITYVGLEDFVVLQAILDPSFEILHD
jgi:hypothetical protein